MKKRLMKVVAGLMTIGLVGSLGFSACAEDYPTRTVEFVVPFGAGGSADLFARSFAKLMSEETGENVNVVNKEGAGGVTGLSYAAEQDADGYTLCLVTPSMPIAQAKGTFDFTGEFKPVALMEMDIYVVSVLDSNQKFTDWEGFVEYAQAHPGDVTTGGSSSGGLDEYEARQLGEHIGSELTYVPYDGYGEYKSAFLGGEVDLYIDKLSSFTQMQQYEQIVPMVIINESGIEVEGLEEVPSTVELGIDFTTGSWRGIVVREDTPDEIVEYLREICSTIYESEAFQEVLKNDNADVVYGYKDADEFEELINSEVDKYTEIVQKFSNQ